MIKSRNAIQTKPKNRFSWLDGLLHLIYPELCLVCDSELARSEKNICSSCYANLHFTTFENYIEANATEQLFWGRAQLQSAYSLLYYEKTNSSKALLQALKYEHKPQVGEFFGEHIGLLIKDKLSYKTIDVLIPVPLHPKKLHSRGYNQSEQIAIGISKELGVPVNTKALIRAKNAKSQTRLGRFDRWDNVNDQFLSTKEIGQYKHIALVDDVITTGSTLESIIQDIQSQYPSIQVSVISLALAK